MVESHSGYSGKDRLEGAETSQGHALGNCFDNPGGR